MRMPAVSVLILVLFAFAGSNFALAEDVILSDQWTAGFVAGEKVGWNHVRLIRTTDSDTGAVRYVSTSRRWVPVGAEVITTRGRTVTDETGRILEFESLRDGPSGRLVLRLKGRKYKAILRDHPPREGELEDDVYSVRVVCALVRSGALPLGERTLAVPDIAAEGLESETFTVSRTADGGWLYECDGVSVLRDKEGRFVSEREKKALLYVRRPATKESAPDRTIRDDDGDDEGRSPRILGRSVAIDRPAGPWRLHREAITGGMMTGLEHPLGIALIVGEFAINVDEGEAALVELAGTLRTSLNGRKNSPVLGEPGAGTFRGRPAAVMAISGHMDMEAVDGAAHLVRSKEGRPVLILGVYAKELGDRCAPLLASAMEVVHLDAVEVRQAWKRVSADAGRFSFEVPETWNRHPSTDYWISAQKTSRAGVNTANLPEGLTISHLHDRWVAKFEQGGRVVGLRAGETVQVEVDGVTMYQRTVTGSLADTEPLRVEMTTTSLCRVAGTRLIEIVVLLTSVDSTPADRDRIIDSIRWSDPK